MGVYTLESLHCGEMVIEYIGEVVRNNMADKREKIYEKRNIGCYMWKLDFLNVVDATFKGNLARYINHSCDVKKKKKKEIFFYTFFLFFLFFLKNKAKL